MNRISVQKQHHLTGHKDSLYALCALDDQRFFSAGGDGMVVLWDLANPETGQMILNVPTSVYALKYHSEKELLVVGQNFSGIHLVDIASKKELKSVALTKGRIFDIQTTDRTIYVCTEEGELILLSWELEILKRVKAGEKSIRCIAVHEVRKELAIGTSDNTIKVFDLDLNQKHVFQAHDISVFTVKYHPELPLLISASRDAKFKTWDIDNGYKLVEKVSAHMYAINHIEFAPFNDWFATCSMDKSIKVWDSSQFKLLKVIDKARHAGHATSVNKLLWMNYRNWLVSCSDDRTLSVWEVQRED
ncbi:MAG: WD40 repeat domain-containing protein [Cyclobacteriaceae bacterium]